MAITRGALQKIIELVAADPECQSRIEDIAYKGSMVSHMGWAGSERNFYMAAADALVTHPLGDLIEGAGQRLASRRLTDDPHASVRDKVAGALAKAGSAVKRVADPTEASVERLVCTGIAHAVNQVLSGQRALKEVPGLASANTINRLTPVDHTANGITMKDGTSYALDWHASLDLHAPFISTIEGWMAHTSGWRYREQGTFPGFITLLRDDPAPAGVDG
jgi:hypothetical protein